MFLRLTAALLVVAALIGVTSCTWKTSVQTSVLVILVEDLGFGAFSCNEGEIADRSSGFQVLCAESVRFTHAYTPSVMSQASVASILTGKLPRELGVRHNGPQALSAVTETVAEAALERGYRTAFFSGGPPIFRRGFNQGFEFFDDNVPVSLKKLYRSAQEVGDLFLSWQSSEASHKRFLSVLYYSDLQFPETPTVNDLGEIRESSFSSQLEEVDESLGNLFEEMKARRIWDSTDVFLVGLNGYTPNSPDERLGELQASNLFSEASHAILMIKPSRKRRDGPFNWKIDANVSLVDVGTTIFDLIVGRFPSGLIEETSSGVSLKSALSGPEPEWPSDRMITSESAWPAWRGIGGIRAVVRRGSYLYVLDEPDALYNTLTDNFETTPLPYGDQRSFEIRTQLSQYLRDNNYESWQPPNRLTLEKLILARDLWRRREVDPDDIGRLKKLVKRYPEDAELTNWLAILSLRRSDWSDLKEVAGKKPERADWSFVAAKNLGEKTTVPSAPCFSPLKSRSRVLSPECTDEGVSELYQWTNESLNEATRTRSLEKLVRIQAAKALESLIAESNLANGWTWDTSVQSLTKPDMVELILALPEMRKFRSILRQRVNIEGRISLQ